MFHPLICCITLEDFHARTKETTCCFYFALSFCRSFFFLYSWQILVTGRLQSHYMLDGGEFVVFLNEKKSQNKDLFVWRD
jgi:hypothetical protein